ncbi:MAG: RecQ family ATP-dependent DNA helicase [Bacteroidaceae bacterium]|nr:RecQ family ATP-dependent DNA helicase [Bacteroidaceae bacterium]
MTYLDVLKQYWGYDSFRGIQEQIIRSIDQGKDTLGLMPTGGGKSISFQVPAMLKPGVCLVITPLIALMKDQVANLKKVGIKALSIHSGMSREQIVTALENCIFGDYKFLYVSPERLSTDIFQTKIRHMKVSMICVDEAHCISQWGYDFRPSYLEIAKIRKLLPGVPVLALTATATPRVVEDIQDRLMFREHNSFSMSFSRTNLSYVVRKTENKELELFHILEKVPGSAIVYVRNRRETKEIADKLNAAGFSADYYHAGLETYIKDQRQNSWTMGMIRVIVATNAFGMGIDKPDVRLVVHMDLPSSIEEYFQEAGRAGRDGLRSYAVLLFAPGDKRVMHKRISDNFPDRNFICRVYDCLGYYYQMAVGDGEGCRKNFSLADFCSCYSLPVIPTDSALRILTRMGVIEYLDQMEYGARVKINVNRDSLFEMSFSNIQESILQTLMRMHGGLFSEYVVIDELLVEKKLCCSHEQFYSNMIQLSRQHVIEYIPAQNTQVIVWTQSRLDSGLLYFSDDVYLNRRKDLTERIDAMLTYATRVNACRSQMLLEYFGEKNSEPCGHCDLCLERNSSGLSNVRFHTVENGILQALEDNARTEKELFLLPYDEQEIETVLKYLVSEELVTYTRDGFAIKRKSGDLASRD